MKNELHLEYLGDMNSQEVYEISALVVKSLREGLEKEEEERLMGWAAECAENRELLERLLNAKVGVEELERMYSRDVQRGWERVLGKKLQRQKRLVGIWRWIGIVAAMLVIVIGVSWLYLRQTIEIQEIAGVEIMPGSAKAVLVLADGEEVNLGLDDSLFVDLSSGVQVVNKGKQLVYTGEQSERKQYNELRVPRGGEYEVVLADGTLVKLNAESSLKYPESFGTEQREVVLSGEAFFQVAKSTVPFIVKVGDLAVKVYGTSFNINTQKTDCIQTVLVEGKVGIKMAGNEREYILKPSQLADFNTSTGVMEVKDVELAPYIAWTRGEFVFDNQRLEDIMQTLSLWYDMEVFYQNTSLKELHFTGYVKRYQEIDQILNALSLSVGVKFSQQGKTLIVSE